MNLDSVKDYLVEKYTNLKIVYNDGMGGVIEYGKYRAKCAEAHILYVMAEEMGIGDSLVEPPDTDDEWSVWDGLNGTQYSGGEADSEEDEEMIRELGELPEDVQDDDGDYDH